VSREQEIAIGEKSFPQALQQLGGEYSDAELNAYVDRIGERLGRLSQRPDLPYRFRVVNDSTPNAFALPGGFIAISRGLLVHLENEAQLAAVLGHEVGHVAARHSVQGLQRGALFNLASVSTTW
jgi:predicted Zn-dependent protease